VIAVQLSNGWRPVTIDLAVTALGAVVLPYPVGGGHRDAPTRPSYPRVRVSGEMANRSPFRARIGRGLPPQRVPNGESQAPGDKRLGIPHGYSRPVWRNPSFISLRIRSVPQTCPQRFNALASSPLAVASCQGFLTRRLTFVAERVRSDIEL
jgi:hypothetical protein